MAYISFQPHDYFNILLYAGNDTDNRAITGVGFQPDWTWIKLRNTSQQHELFDAVRGANKPISTNSSGGETTETNKLKSFDSDGFTLGTSTSVNKNYNYVSWNWKANGAGSSNTDGSVTSTVSFNSTSKMSIVKWTGTGSAATIGHGLGGTPDYIIVKCLDSGENWVVWSNALAANKFLRLSTTAAVATDTAVWNNTLPTSTVFSVSNDNTTNKSGAGMVAYCFRNVKGFSKFGKYLGNGSATESGVIYLGFKPSFFMIKNIDASEPWMMYDAKRLGYNPAYSRLYANTNGAEDAETKMDFISNGVKLRSAGDGHINQNGYNFIYMAFAENPLVSSNNIPALAKGI